ncbi:MAG: T9SS type A sorting domain-containing protein [Bacteroidales bacterium]|nr:T9SS type A sorting domain-containing protein [Bacteroidales bacterium]MBR6439360.1 T9SS type A sorting domain-containing protein [Bacteroidales bacterium]
MMKKIALILLIPLILLGFTISLSAQNDTLKVMQYNLLNYGNNTGYCNTTNNNINDKNGYIRTILTAYYPDILTVCEMGRSTSLPNDFVSNVLNINGLNYWMTSAGSNTGNSSSLINCIFYNSTKLTLTGHYVAQTYTRDVDVYDFKFKNDDSGHITLTCVIAHLKAGTGTDNEGKRKIMAENTMRYLESNYRERNVLIMGDFNLYTSAEDAYQALTNQTAYPNSYFIDPLYPYGVGAWNNNGSYAEYHTQSTHKDNDSDCHSSGGMDDRFDFILMSENIYGGRDGIRYVGGSYNALGNDGRRFNKSINNPTNYAVSQDVADALFGNSDHIPVTMELVAYLNEDVNELTTNELSYDIFPNPASKELNIRFYQDSFGKANILLFNTLGQLVYSDNIFVDDSLSEYVIPVEDLQKGLYFLNITNADGLKKTIKIIVE